MVTRRFLLTAGAAGAVVLGASVGGVAVLGPSLAHARAPWDEARRGFGDPRLDALAFAILAPSPHNRQPWLIELDGADALRVFCQLDRRLPQTDPLDRQIVIGFGAFLELLRMAAADQGFSLDVTPFPDGAPDGRLDNRPVAQVRFREVEIVRDPLFDQVLNRRTVRTPFTVAVPEARSLQRVFAEPMTGFTTDPDRCARLKALCVDGWSVEHAYPPTLEESVELTRIGAGEVNADPDGIALYGPAIEAARISGALSRDAMRQPGGWANRQVHDFYVRAIEASPAFGWLTADGDSQLERLDAGRRWLRVHLAATAEGLGFQPLSQVLQEFEPMRPLLEAIHAELARDGARVHGLFRLGFGDSPGPAPRWRLESRLKPL